MKTAHRVQVQYDAQGKPLHCPRHEHQWESGGTFGIIIGVSCCEKCGKVSSHGDFHAAGVLDDAEG